MKRKISVMLVTLFIISFSLIIFTACGNNDNNDDIADVGGLENSGNGGDSGNTNNGGNNEQSRCVPVYQGMTITNSNTTISLTSANYRSGGIMLLSSNNENNGDSGNHYGHYKGDHADRDNVVDNDNPYPDNSDNENIEEEIESSLNVIGATSDLYYATQNQDVYINIHIYNPDNFEIMSFTLNGKKYSSYMFEEGSDMETIVLKYNVGAVSGIVEYTIDAIKYIDGTEIKDVIIDGDKTVKAGIKTANQLTTSISGVEIDTNALSFNANIVDNDNLITFSSGTLKAVIYDGVEIVAQQDLTVGENSITFANLKTNTLYQYAIVGYYDDLSGDGFKMNILYKDAFYTDAVVLFNNITVRQESINFSFLWHEDHQNKAISALKLYKNEAFVKDITASATSVSELLSGNTYKLVAEYSHGGNTESIYIEFTTLAKATPEISVVNLSNTQTSISFEINKIDVDNVGAITKIELVHQNGTIIADSLEQRVFENLLSGNEYTIKITYKYDLNDGDGEKVSTKEINVSTISKAVPTLSITTVEKTKDSISFGVVENDIDNVGTITKIELINPRGTIVADSIDQRTFSNLLSNNEYTLKITYTYDLNDGKGTQTITQTEQITTDAKSAPSITFDNAVSNSSAISFGINEIDADGIGEIIKIELLLGNDVVRTTTDVTVRTFTDLLSNTEYTVRMTYKYNLSNGSEDVTLTRTINIRTSENTIPSILISAGNQTQTSISFAIEESDISGVGSVSKIELLKNGVLIKTAENINVREFAGLLSNTEYTVKVSYDYDLNDGSGKRNETREIKIKTFSKVKPSIIFETTDRTKTSISFDFNIVDVDNIGYIERIDLLRNGDVVSVTTNGNDREFVNLLSDTKYTVKVIFAYDLNDGSGVAYIEKTVDITTYAKAVPEISVSNPTKTQTSVGFSITETDTDNVGAITKIELVHASGTVVAESLDQRSFTNLLSNNDYTVKVTYVYDLNDGNGSKTITKNLAITTLAKVTPDLTIMNTARGQESLNFSVSVTDNDAVGAITKIELIHGTAVTALANETSHEITELLSNNDYTIRVTYTYDLNDGAGDREIIKELIARTLSKQAPSITVNSATEKNAIHVEISNNDTDKTLIEVEATVLLDGTIVKTQKVTEIFTVEELLYSTNYSVYITAYYDLNDGAGVRSKEFYSTVTTLNYVDEQGVSYKVSQDGTATVVELSEKHMTNIIIPEEVIGYNVTSIGDCAFKDCTNLVSVIIPDTVETIGYNAFNGCSALKTLIIGNGVTTLCGGLLSGCSSLENLTIPFVGDSKNATSFSHSSLFGWIFGTESYAGGVDTNQYFKQYCIPSSLTSVTVNGGNIPEYAFYECDNITSIVIPNSVTVINERTFYSCDSLVSVTIPSSVIGIEDHAFYFCTSLTSVTIPDSVEYIGNYAFGACNSLINVNIPNSVTALRSYVFWACESLISATIGNGVDDIGTLFCDCSSLTSVTLSNGIKSIGGYAFYGCTNLTSITIPESVDSFGDYAFGNCSRLEEIHFNATWIVEDWCGTEVFYDAGTYGNGINMFVGKDVIKIPASLFEASSPPKITYVTFEDGSSCQSIGKRAFYGCTNLVRIDIPNNVNSIEEYAFYGCTSLISVTIPDGVRNVGERTFYKCSNLTIYCMAGSKPSGWNSDWNYSNCPVVWGYKG